jgi:hypothetical protein
MVEVLREGISSRGMARGIILSRRLMGSREVITIIGGVGVAGLWRRCWRVWRVVAVWMLACCFKLGERC